MTLKITITGEQGCGKTTARKLIKEALDKGNAGGYVIEEIQSCNIPRRMQLSKITLQELLIRDAIAMVEALGEHPKLTYAAMLLQQAQNEVADFIDFGGKK